MESNAGEKPKGGCGGIRGELHTECRMSKTEWPAVSKNKGGAGAEVEGDEG